MEAHSEDGIVLTEEEEGLRGAVLVLSLQLGFEELLLQCPRISIGDTAHIAVAIGLYILWKREDTGARFVDHDILLVVSRLQIFGEHSLQLGMRRGMVREVREKGQLGANGKLRQQALDILHRLVAGVRTLIAQGIDDEEL